MMMGVRAFNSIVGLVLCAMLAGADAQVVDMPDFSYVTCGSSLKLQHAGTKARLHSHEITYGSGSGQQSVTGFPKPNDSNSYWTVKARHGERCDLGVPIKNGDKIRLMHANTRKWLHSHLHQSPISGNQEVSAFGEGPNADEGNVDDDWIVETSNPKGWMRDEKIRLKHASTGLYLHSHKQKYGRPIAGQFEVCARDGKDSNNLWLAAEGVYLPIEEPETTVEGKKDEL